MKLKGSRKWRTIPMISMGNSLRLDFKNKILISTSSEWSIHQYTQTSVHIVKKNKINIAKSKTLEPTIPRFNNHGQEISNLIENPSHRHNYLKSSKEKIKVTTIITLTPQNIIQQTCSHQQIHKSLQQRHKNISGNQHNQHGR